MAQHHKIRENYIFNAINIVSSTVALNIVLGQCGALTNVHLG